VIDATGTVLAGARMAERTLLIGEVAVGEPRRTLIVAWGNWVGRAGAAFLLLLFAAAVLQGWRSRGVKSPSATPLAAALPARVIVLPPAARFAAAALRAFARAGLLWMVAAVLLDDGAFRANALVQLRTFVAFFLAPEAAAWFVTLAFRAVVSIDDGALVLRRGGRRLALAVRDIAAVEPWRVPLPSPGLSLRLASGGRWRYGLAQADPAVLAEALVAAGAGATFSDDAPSPARTYAGVRAASRRGRLDAPFAKFGMLPLLLAIPAFRLHQHIAYGGTLGEYYTFGLPAYLTTFALWWAAWAIGMVLRAAIEVGTMASMLLAPGHAIDARRWLERLGLGALYLGVPAWLAWRALAN
jgi:apolipoprotein N-acyltransferase